MFYVHNWIETFQTWFMLIGMGTVVYALVKFNTPKK
jgi:hypothetical protein